ncbi:MAG: ASKHA domain-containing protein [Promethearchaeota archaeon]
MDLKSKKIIIDFEPISRRVILSSEEPIYNLISEIGIPIRSICGGSGTCGKCKLLVQKGKEFFVLPTSSEKKFIDQKELEYGWRLACQARIDVDKLHFLATLDSPQIRVFLPNELILEDFKILTDGKDIGVALLPSIKKYYLIVDKALLRDPQADFERIVNKLFSNHKEFNKKGKININFDLLKELPNILRENDNKITAVVWKNNTIIACEPGNTVEDNFGIAFDIGTTTIVGYLINLNNGKIYAIASNLNSQTAYGEDVITRLTFIKNNKENLNVLNSVVINDLNQIIFDTCSEAGVDPSRVYEVSVVGNSVMHHLFLGIDPTYIGISPYVPVIQKGLHLPSKSLNLKMSKTGIAYIAPVISGFVGADTIGVILSSKIYNEKALTLAIDIGTNGEIIIGNKKVMAVGSCAAGSALEGAHISNGMRAAAGAIDTLKINPNTLEVIYTTIKDKKPIGICGSGLVDIVAEMLKSKILTRSGNFNKEFIDHERIVKNNKTFEFIIAKKSETSLGKEISISQNDIRQIQMAKAAFFSGTRLILKTLNKSNLKIEQVFLAGAFGNYINAQNAKFIGMIPDIPNHKIYQIGNAAGIGAQYCLLNSELRNKAEHLLKKIKYVEIAIKEEFQKEYAEAMYFPHLNLNYFPSLIDYREIQKR